MTKYTYIQSTGQLLKDGIVIGVGYSGLPPGKNDSSMQDIPDVGPIPIGIYTCGRPTNMEHLGPLVTQLIPNADNEMYGRSGFFIHGDSYSHPGLASEGCIIMPYVVREVIQEGDEITVVPTSFFVPINLEVADQIKMEEKING